jgi:hypothetical protein
MFFYEIDGTEMAIEAPMEGGKGRRSEALLAFSAIAVLCCISQASTDAGGVVSKSNVRARHEET